MIEPGGKKMNKKTIYSEVLYILAIIILAFAVNLMSIADLGMSMIVCPAYILSEKFDLLTYGQAEYLIATIVFIIFCLVMKKFKILYLLSYLTGILYALFSDLIKIFIPMFNQNLMVSMNIRIIYFFIGMILSGLAVALFYKTYLYPQIYDFFVKVVAQKYQISIKFFKTCFDCSFLIISFIMSYVLFGELIGIGIGTIIMAFCNGMMIEQFQNIIDQYFVCIPHFEKLKIYLEGGI